MALSWTMDKLGPMARSAEDCSIVLRAIEGPDPNDPTAVAMPSTPPAAGKKKLVSRRLRVGVPKDADKYIQKEVASNFREAVAVLERFADVHRDVVLPDFPYGFCASTIVSAEGATAFLALIEGGRLNELQARSDRVGYANAMTPAVDYLQAMRLRGKMREPFAVLYEKYDVLVAPARDTVANPIGIDFDKAFTDVGKDRPQGTASATGVLIQAGNLLGLPALCLPDGFGQNGLPTAIQLVGAPFREDHLIALGAEYQRRTAFHARRPPEAA
jgi:aspartyl-tRNA(Asn)/glutamyl-tRNA(Gln) amidotransferase subunit A